MSVLLVAGPASAWQVGPSPPIKPVPPVLSSPPPELRFQQAVQQQQARDRLQQSQLEQQLHQGVAKNASRPVVANPKTQQQRDQAEQAQLDLERARQQDLMDQYRLVPALPRVVPKELPPTDQESKNH